MNPPEEAPKMTPWHSFVHRMGWQNGRVVSWTTADKRIMIGFKCSTCGKVTGPIDATSIVDRDTEQILRVIKRNTVEVPDESAP